jgi:hypothetical protein
VFIIYSFILLTITFFIFNINLLNVKEVILLGFFKNGKKNICQNIVGNCSSIIGGDSIIQSGGKTTVNGVTVSGNNISIRNGVITVDGKTITEFDNKIFTIKIEGDVANVTCDQSLTIVGNIKGKIESGGSISCDNIEGNVNANGSINCDDISGDAQAGGSINCDDIGGNARAGGSIYQ